MAASWQITFTRLGTEHPAALQLLGLAAHLAPEPIPFILFTTHPDQLPPPLAATAADPLAFTDLIGVLRHRTLARIETDTLQLHRLIAALLRQHPSTDLKASASATVALRLLKATAPPWPWNNLTVWPTWRQLLPHVLTLTDPARIPIPEDENTDTVAWLLDRAATYLHARGEPRPALPLATRAHHLYRTLHGADHPATLESANNLAIRLGDLGKYEQACSLAEDTLARRRRTLGEDHPATLESAHVLAFWLGGLGEYGQARALAEDTLARRRRTLGEDHLATMTSANNLVLRLNALGEYEQARIWLRTPWPVAAASSARTTPPP